MEYEIVNFLVNEDFDTLCSSYDLYSFQAQILSFMYLNTKNEKLKEEIVNDIIRGKYCTDQKVKEMFKSYIDKAVKYSKDNGLSILIDKCRLNEDDARAFINSYLKQDKNIDDMLSAELDVSNINIRMNEMIEEILPIFLDNERRIML
ncbi:MAG: hypothetical protein IKR57_02330 [Bacilli bacterium]|nr:hypothetical protein [Bacilli bacterium]